MRRWFLSGPVALLTVMAVSLVVLPGTSYAASGLDTTGGSFVTSSIWEAPRPAGGWRVGDCTMLGGYTPTGSPYDNRTVARLIQPDASGHSDVYIFEATSTANSPTDVWWTTLTFYDAFGTVLLTTPRIPGDRMTTTNHVYIYDAWAAVTMDPQLFPLITAVTWVVSC